MHFDALLKLPSQKEITEARLSHVFWLQGRPQEVSDLGPQFASPFWKEFCKLLRVSASLSPGFMWGPMDRRNGTARRWRQSYGVSQLRTFLAGSGTSCGWNAPTTCFPWYQLASLLFSVYQTAPFPALEGEVAALYPLRLTFSHWRKN